MTIQFKKAIMRTGTFNKPDGSGTFTVTTKRLDHWAKTFADMWKRKINVPIVLDHIVDTTHVVGKVLEMKREGNFLFASLEFSTPEYAELARNNDVSIGSKDILLTGVKVYQDGIEHVSLTPRPVVPDLGGYTLLCSLGDYAGKEGFCMETIAKILDAVATFMGVEVPEEAKVSEEAAFTFISTVLSCATALGGSVESTSAGDGAVEGSGKEDGTPIPTGSESGEKTPGEDEIVASLNASRKYELQSFLGRGGINASLIESWQKQYCAHKSIRSFVASASAYGALTQGLRLSLGAQDDILKTSSGTQYSTNGTAGKSLFMQRAEARAKRK